MNPLSNALGFRGPDARLEFGLRARATARHGRGYPHLEPRAQDCSQRRSVAVSCLGPQRQEAASCPTPSQSIGPLRGQEELLRRGYPLYCLHLLRLSDKALTRVARVNVPWPDRTELDPHSHQRNNRYV